MKQQLMEFTHYNNKLCQNNNLPVESSIIPIAVFRAPSITGGLALSVRLNRSLPSTSVSHTIGILTVVES